MGESPTINCSDAVAATPSAPLPSETTAGPGPSGVRSGSRVELPAKGRLTSATIVRGCTVVAGVVAVDQLTKAAATAAGNTWITHPVSNPKFSLGVAGGPLPMMVLVTVTAIIAFNAYIVVQAVRGRLPAWIPGRAGRIGWC